MSHRRLLGLIAAYIVVGVVPAIVAGLAGAVSWINPLIYGWLVAASAALHSWRWGLILVGLTAAFAIPATALSAEPILGALVMAIVAAGTGISAIRGRHATLSLLGMVTAFILTEPAQITGPDPTLSNGVASAGLILIGGAWVVVIQVLVIKKYLPDPPPVERRTAIAYAISLTVVIGASTWWVLTFEPDHAGGWLLMTVFIVMQPSFKDTITKSSQRALGTVLGVLLASVVAVTLDAPLIAFILGLALMYAAFAVRYVKADPYWQYVTLITPGIVLLSSIGTSFETTALDRLGNTLAAAGIVVALAYLLALINAAASKVRS